MKNLQNYEEVELSYSTMKHNIMRTANFFPRWNKIQLIISPKISFSINGIIVIVFMGVNNISIRRVICVDWKKYNVMDSCENINQSWKLLNLIAHCLRKSHRLSQLRNSTISQMNSIKNLKDNFDVRVPLPNWMTSNISL